MDLPELIAEAKQGSAAAQKCVFDLFAEKMAIVCRRYVKSPQDAEELMLDGFYKFFKSLPSFSFQSEAAFYVWLKRIMVNECLMFLRKKTAFTIVSESSAEEIPLQEDLLDKISAVEIVQLIIQLPVGYRTVFNLYSIEGFTHKDIAGMLNISEGTSKSQLSKARSLLQKMLVQNHTEYVKRKTQ